MNAPQPASPALPIAEPPPRRPFWLRLLRPKVAIPLLIVLLAVAAVLGYRQSRLIGLPDVEEPFEPIAFDESVLLDEENAYADYVRANELAVNSDSPEFTGGTAPLSSGAHPISREIHECHERVLAVGWSESSPLFRRWFERNSARLPAYRRGADKSRVLFPDEPQLGEMTISVSYGAIGTARLVIAIAWKKLETDDVSAAWNDLRAVLRTSRQFLAWDDVSEFSAGRELLEDTLPATEAWARHSRVDADLLHSALWDVRDADAIAGPPSETVRRGYAIYWNFLRKHPFPRAYFDYGRNIDWGEAIRLFLQNEPEVSLRCARLCGTNIRQFVDRDPWDQPPLTAPVPEGPELFELPLGTAPPKMDNLALAERLLNSQFADPMPRHLSAYFTGQWHWTKSVVSLKQILTTRRSDRARMRLVEALLCAEIVRRETGLYPAKLEDLVRPDLLTEVPRDPWSPTGEPLRYRVGDDGVLTIWSLGADQTDDDGHIHRNVEKSNDIAVTSRPREVPLPRFGSTPDPMPADPPSDPEP